MYRLYTGGCYILFVHGRVVYIACAREGGIYCLCTGSLGIVADCANFVRFRGSKPLLPHLCPLSVPEVGVYGVYSESP